MAVQRKLSAVETQEIQEAFDKNLKDEAGRLAREEKARTAEARRKEQAFKQTRPPKKTHIRVKGKGASAKRLDQILNNEFVSVEPGNEQLPVGDEVLSATKYPRLKEYAVEGTAYRLLGMEDPSLEPTIEERVAMARRLNEVGPKLPKYVHRVHLAPHVIPEKPELPPEESMSEKIPRKAKDRSSKPTTPGGIPLKKLCALVEIDPKDARAILRKGKIEKPGGRWEWTSERAEEIKKLLQVGRDAIIRSKLQSQ